MFGDQRLLWNAQVGKGTDDWLRGYPASAYACLCGSCHETSCEELFQHRREDFRAHAMCLAGKREKLRIGH